MRAREDRGEQQVDDVVALEEASAQGSANGVKSAERRGLGDGELSFHRITS